MRALEQLLAEQDCRNLVYRAAAYADNSNLAALAELYTEDAVLVRPGAQPLTGREEIRAAYDRRPADRITRHLVAQTLIAFPESGVAHGLSLVQLWIGSNAAPGPHGCRARVQRVGEFEDRFALTSLGWRIARREARFVLHSDAIAGQS